MADRKFNAALEAFNILSDPQRRAMYDTTGQSSGGGTRHEVVSYLSDVFGDLSMLKMVCGSLWLELVFCDDAEAISGESEAGDARDGADNKTTDDDLFEPADAAAASGVGRATGTGAQASSMGVKIARHLYSSVAYSMIGGSRRRSSSATEGNSAESGTTSDPLLQRQQQREDSLVEEIRERLHCVEEKSSEIEDSVLKNQLVQLSHDIATAVRKPGYRLLRAAARGLSPSSSSWGITAARTAHLAKAQWYLARAAGSAIGSALFSLVGGSSDETSADHATEAVTQLTEADVLCTTFAIRTALLKSNYVSVSAAIEKRLLLLAEALIGAVEVAEFSASQSLTNKETMHKLKMSGGVLYLGAAAKAPEAKVLESSDNEKLLPHGSGRLLFADGSCHEGVFEYGRAHGRGRLFVGATGGVFEGSWHQNKRSGPFEAWDSKGVKYQERYDHSTGKKVARKKATSAEGEANADPDPALKCTRCNQLFHRRWGLVQWCRSHASEYDGCAGKWSCCGDPAKDSPGCQVTEHVAPQ
eukprot:TRINITY_DN19680_c0_g1_i1.p1 TRINITY_DN19680_c0_g1~~TRINITY_DN19680_c0_g1_i1.p1  ORF type:complete len:596 (+),score=73.38 TRINITY_DN19680_c0_g1_i1:202-1788(+)